LQKYSGASIPGGVAPVSPALRIYLPSIWVMYLPKIRRNVATGHFLKQFANTELRRLTKNGYGAGLG
jgi:hypothetical protein